MAKKKSRQQENAIKKIWRDHEAIFFLLVMAICVSLFLLVARENPKKWTEKDIVIHDISTVDIYRGRYYEITDTDGNTYSISGSNKNAEKLVRGNTYRIIHGKVHWNRIQYMADSTTEYVNYQESLRYNRNITIAGCGGVSVSVALALFLLIRISGKIQAIRGKKRTKPNKLYSGGS